VSLHNEDQRKFFDLSHPAPYQTLGLGIAAHDSVFLYPFLKFYPLKGNLGTDTVLAGFNAIINLF